METIRIKKEISREAEGVPCVCGGYADRVPCSPEELKETDHSSHECCGRAFVCRLCKQRLIGKAEAPEYPDWED